MLVAGVVLTAASPRAEDAAYSHKWSYNGANGSEHLNSNRVLTPIRMVRVGELKQLNGCAVFDDERDAHAVGWAVRRNQNFPAYQLGRKVTHLKSYMWYLPDQLRNSCVRFEPHPFHAILAVFVSDNKDL